MAILETKKGTAFYKTGPLYQQAEADRKAEENLLNSESQVESRNVTEQRGKDERGRTYTDYITTTNLKNKGKGESTGRPSYKEYAASGGDVEEAKKYWAERSKNRKETSTKRVYDKIEGVNLIKLPLVPLTTDFNVGANVQVKKPTKPTVDLNLKGGSYRSGKIGKPDVSLNTSFSNKRSGKCPAGRNCKGAVN
jgi:hypothetical protein